MTLDDHLPAAPHGRWEWLAAGAGGVGHTGCVIAQTNAQERWHGGTCEWLSSSPCMGGGIRAGAVAVQRTLTSFLAPTWITWRCRDAYSQVSAARHGVTQGWTCSRMSGFCTCTAAVLWLLCL